MSEVKWKDNVICLRFITTSVVSIIIIITISANIIIIIIFSRPYYNGRAIGTLLRLSVCDVMYCG